MNTFYLSMLRPIRNLVRVFSKERSPRQMAAGIALGVVIGLVPKGNLVAVTLTVILFALRVNLGMGLSTAFLVSLGRTSLDELAHRIGVRALQTPWVYASLSTAFQWPIVPWTSLNNTVVLGSTLLGALLFYPAYHLSHLTIEFLRPWWNRLRTHLRRRSRDGSRLAAEGPEVADEAGGAPVTGEPTSDAAA